MAENTQQQAQVDILLTFLKEIKDGKYAKLESSSLCAGRITAQREEEQSYLNESEYTFNFS